MAERAAERMTAAAFLAFTAGREERWDLVDGVPQMMAGAKRQHDRIVVNTLGLLAAQLRGRSCEPFTADTFIRIPSGNYRMPDAGVDCGQAAAEDRAAKEPRLVVEVLSPSTRDFDMFGKLDEYKSVETLWHIVLIDPDMPQATAWSRDGAGDWSHRIVLGLEAEIRLAALDLVLPLAELYARIEFPPRPRLVETA